MMVKHRTKLTEVEIRNAPIKEKDYFLYDPCGVRLLVRKSGTKVWQLPYRCKGKANVYTVGKYLHPMRPGYYDQETKFQDTLLNVEAVTFDQAIIAPDFDIANKGIPFKIANDNDRFEVKEAA